MKFNLKEKKILLPIIFVLVTLALLMMAMTNKEENELISFEEVRATKGDLKIEMISDGVIELNTVNLQFGTNGVLAQILVGEGEKVEKDEIIATLEDSSYINEVEIANAKLQKAKSLSEQIKQPYLAMEKNPEAYARLEIESKKLDLDKSYSDIQEAQANLNKARENFLDTVLKSPVSGTVVQINGKIGEVVSISSDGSKGFAVVSEENVKVVAKVLELDIGEVWSGQNVEVVIEAFPDEILTGQVSKIAYLPTTDNNGIVAYEVEIELIESNDRPRDGMTCTISFISKEVNDVIILPNKAVKMVEGKQVVDMLLEGEKIQREIKTGFTDGYKVEIKEGLKAGDIVLIYN